jgi:hypothetical protein
LNAASLTGGDAKAPPAAILYYFDQHQPVQYTFPLPEGAGYKAELIDPWEMTIAELAGEHRGKALIRLPARPYLAVRFTRVQG